MLNTNLRFIILKVIIDYSKTIEIKDFLNDLLEGCRLSPGSNLPEKNKKKKELRNFDIPVSFWEFEKISYFLKITIGLQ